MAGSKKKKDRKSNASKRTGRFHVDMTDRVKLLLAACFVIGFVGMCVIVLLSSR
jgi:hypothetical protein